LIEVLGEPSQEEIGQLLGVRREYISRILNGLEPSDALMRSIDAQLALARRAPGVRESQSSFGAPSTLPRTREHVVAIRKPAGGAPSTRADVEAYFKHYLDRAEGSGNPNAFPAIQTRVERQFPLDEWDEYEPPKLEER
jgi:hypothetical protein